MSVRTSKGLRLSCAKAASPSALSSCGSLTAPTAVDAPPPLVEAVPAVGGLLGVGGVPDELGDEGADVHHGVGHEHEVGVGGEREGGRRAARRLLDEREAMHQRADEVAQFGQRRRLSVRRLRTVQRPEEWNPLPHQHIIKVSLSLTLSF